MVSARDLMHNRGPDGHGLWSTPGVMLGHRRLAILDLSEDGAQPMRSPSGRAIVFNGEIYNFVELRDELRNLGATFRSSSDTEVLLAAVDHWGMEVTLERVRGMFAFALWDPESTALHLARDPVGKKPLFWTEHAGGAAFASSLAALTCWTGGHHGIDPVAVEHFLAGGYVPSPRTIFEQFHKLEPGCWARVTASGVQVRRYHDVPFAQPGRRLDETAIDDLEAHLSRAVQRRLRSDVPVATFLSGGLDSSLVTAHAARQHPGITAYTVRTHNHNSDEFDLARRIADHTGARHEILEITGDSLARLPELVDAYGEPFGDSSALPSFLIAELAGKEHTVVLTGDGGDEVQGGYNSARTFALRQLIHRRARLPGWRKRPWPEPTRPRLRRLSFRADRLLATGDRAIGLQFDGLYTLADLFVQEHHEALEREGWRAFIQRRYGELAAHGELDRQLGIDFTVYLPDDLCVKVDVATMAHSVESRAPLLDIDFVDACWSVRAEDRVRPRRTKRIVRALLDRVLPRHLVLGRKHGFSIPVDTYLASPAWRERFDAAWADEGPLPGVLDASAVRSTLACRAATGRDNSVLRWRLLWLATWAERAPSGPFGA